MPFNLTSKQVLL